MSNINIRNIVQNWVSSGASSYDLKTPGDTDQSAATARGVFLGYDSTDPQASGIAIYTDAQNLPTALASIMNHVQIRADFHPANTSPDKLAAAFSQYINEMDKCPFVHLNSNESTKQVFHSKDYNLLIDQISNLYSSLGSQDLDKIKKSITDMAKSVFGQKSSEQWKNLFSQSTLDMSDPHNPKLYIYYTSLHMFHQQNGKSDVQEQDYEVRMTTYLVLPDQIKTYASSLANLDKKSVDDWSRSSTSPEDPGVKLCFLK
ncbi:MULTISPECIES: hypothetical protein [Pseudomonas]|uniref:Uncharacterized protein n=1 Tax=Pseudomonas fluorescens TaxID=294 RepID=A0A5E6VNP8_PSEFL|nr:MULTISPECIES: hypothetical protein [Pseudomonas]VVN19360.1 hypothetical protein PS652_04241 [Pseudomonas fluorescens]